MHEIVPNAEINPERIRRAIEKARRQRSEAVWSLLAALARRIYVRRPQKEGSAPVLLAAPTISHC